MSNNQQYIPGVCNIGPAEIARRRRTGYAGLMATVVVAVLVVALKAPVYWRLLIFFPVSLAASGFLQARMHFCAGFGMAGVFNFKLTLGNTISVRQAKDREKDRLKAVRILMYSVLIGIALALLAYILL
jgi:hypothetical protein